MAQDNKTISDDRYSIERVKLGTTQFTDLHFSQFIRVLSQLGTPKETLNRFDVLYMCENEFRLLARDSNNDNAIVGTAYIAILNPSLGKKGFIEDVVVDRDHRGAGLGQRLVSELLRIATEEKSLYVDLTSGQSEERKQANTLYTTMGAIKRDTNNYRFMLD